MALEQGGCEVCAEVDNAADAVTAAIEEHPDACLIDLQMPGGGIRAVAAISARLPDSPVLVLTVSGSSDDFFDALRAGAAGDLLKDMDPLQLPVAVRAAVAGEAAVPGFLTARLIDEFRQRGGRRTLTLDNDRTVELTPREWDVLDLLAEGQSTAQIAHRLFLSQVTVRRHMSGVLRKLGVPTREEARRLITERMAPPGERSSH